MKKLISCIVLVTILFSCGRNKSGNMTVTGTIDGLKKGTVYLQKFNDSIIVSIDSVEVNGESVFTLVDNVDSPEMYAIQLDNLEGKSLSFFGEKGEITINTKLDKFTTSAKITGSKNQELLEEHNQMIKKFSDKQLDLIKARFEAHKADSLDVVANIEKQENSLTRRKYLYTVNYALTHNKNEIAPFLALSQLNYANVKLLDTINKSLSKKMKKSKYGIELNKFIERIKELEKK
ncbi:protein of unknown function [Lutibacter oricola]|uniref:DUF4369 domain-containing protein n=1 Tax=Lutibacter oricola TaxID=762486 RepID=A0A1H2Z9F1_9FLAO|nr:DUF4369 domain-containing protein [Lutibacter oricola]SDX13399.1 protein of unknown function [Lutibacter oricola]